MLPSRSLLPTNHLGTDCSACCRRGPYFPSTTSEPTAHHIAVAVPTSYQPLRNRPLSMLPSRSLLPTNHLGTDCSACCRRGPYFPPTTSEPTAQHVALAVPTSHQPLRDRLLSMLPSRSLLPTNHFGTDCSACCRRGHYFPPTTSEPTAQHVAVAVPTPLKPLRKRMISMLPSRSHYDQHSHQPLRNRLHSMLPSRSLLPTNHFGTDCSACCRRGPYFPPTTSGPTAQHVAAAVHTSHQPLLNRLLSMLPSRSLLPTNHFGTNCCCSGPYLPPTTSEPTAQHVAIAVHTSHQPLRNRLLSMLPSRSLLHSNHFGTDCSACCRRGPYISHQPLRNRLLSMLPSRFLYFPPTTSEPTAQHVALAVPTSHQPLRNRLLGMLPSRSLLPPTTSEPTAQHVAVAVPTSHQPLRNRLLSMLPSRSLLPTNQFGTDCSACCRRGPYFPPTTSEPTAQHVALAVPTSHQPLRNQLLL